MKKVKIISVILAALIGLGAGVFAQEQQQVSDDKGKPQTFCPVMGYRINKNSLYVDYNGKRIYVCCQSCIKTVKVDPEKNIEMLEKQGVTLEKIPETVQTQKTASPEANNQSN